MRIFTPGKNGISIFLFALLLFSGTYTYGQDCPTVTDQDDPTEGNQQFFCDSEEAELGDLLVQGSDVAFYADADSNQTMEPTTLLVDGTTYYVGTSTQNCGIAVEVSIYNEPIILGLEESGTRKVNTKQSTGLGTLEICVTDETNPGVFVSDIRTDAPEEEEIWFYSLTLGGTREAIDDPSTFQLIDNAYFYVARDNPFTDCITNTSRVRILLTAEEAPVGPSNQTFCASNNPTLADIDASGNNRYYATATSTVELSANTPLVDGEDYFITTDGESCESDGRLQVTVSVVEVLVGENQSAEVCLAQAQDDLGTVQDARNFFLGMIDPNADTSGTFSPDLQTIVDNFLATGVGEYTTTYTVTNSQACQGSVDLTAIVTENPEAGTGGTLITCASQAQQYLSSLENIETYINNILTTTGADTDGTFEPALADLVAAFESNPVGNFATTYTVTRGGCEDIANFAINVAEDPAAGVGQSTEICLDTAQSVFANATDARTFFEGLLEEGVDATGTFDPTMEELIANFNSNPFQTFSTLYTVSSGGCTDQAEFLVTVTENPDAGADRSVELCLADAQPNFATVADAEAYFLSLTEAGVDQTGTFSPSIDDLVASFNTDPIGTFTTEYTVTSGNCEDTAILSVTVSADPNAGANAALELCLSEANAQISSAADLEAIFTGMIETGADAGGAFNPSFDALYADFQADPTNTFTTEYTVTVAGCTSTAQLVLNVVPDPVAGDDLPLDWCQSDFEALIADPTTAEADLLALLQNEDQGGTFNPTVDEMIAIYEQAVADDNFPLMFTVDYTVTNGQNCSDTATISFTIRKDAHAGEPNSETFCSTELTATQTEAEIEQIFLNLLSAGVATDGTFNPTIAEITADYNSDPIQTFTTTYTVSNAICRDSVDLAFTVQEAVAAEAGDDVELTFCATEGPQNLMDFIADNANPEGYFDQSVFNPAEAGVGTYTFTYTVDGTSACVSDSDTAIYTVEVIDTPTPTLITEPETLCSFDDPTVAELEGTVVQNGDIIWYTSATGTETVAPTTLLVDGAVYFAALVDSATGCESSVRLQVNVVLEDCELLIPEAFSPNGDKINDKFVIEDVEAKYPDFAIEIYNRWGEKVYVGRAGSPYWDGTSTKGSLGDGVLPVGVYFYLLYPNDGETQPIQGRVYLSR